MAEISDDQNAAVRLAKTLLSGKPVPEGFSLGGRLDLARAKKARKDAGPDEGLPRSKFMPGVPRAVHADGGKVDDEPWGDPTQTGVTFRDVKSRPYMTPAQNRAYTQDTAMGGVDRLSNSRVEEVPIRRLFATQDKVNPDFATTESSAGELPHVIRLNGEMYVMDGHHRITKAARNGSQTVRVRLHDFDNPEGAKTPLLDYKPGERQKRHQEDLDLLADLLREHKVAGGSVGLGEVIERANRRRRASGGPVLRSKAAEVAAALPQEQGTVEQMLAMLKKRGVKPAELDNAGRPDGDKISKAELAAHFRERQPNVIHNVQDENRYGEYTAPGEKENYREHLLELGRPRRSLQALQDGEPKERVELLKKADQAEDYRHDHWPEDRNVLAHFRTTNRPGGYLNVEEVQSDWGQEGRKGGFRPAGSRADALLADEDLRNNFMDASNRWAEAEDAHKAAHNASYDVVDRLLKENPDAEFEEINSHPDMLKAMEDVGRLRAEADNWREKSKSLRVERDRDPHRAGMDDKRPPTAPYVTNTGGWVDLALKHIFHEAAKGGYDHVSFNPGEANAKMFGLADKVDSLSYHPETKVLDFYKEGKGWHNGVQVPPEKLGDHVGRELAEKLLSSPRVPSGEHILEGQDLEVGGQGMRSFYNDIIPKAALKLARQHDPDIAPATGPTGGFSLPVTDSLRTSVLQNGFGAFARGGAVGDGPLFDYSRLDEVPRVDQFDLPRYEPPRGVSQRTLDVTSNPDVRDKMHEILTAGERLGGPRWYNADPLRDKFKEVLGSGGERGFRKFMDFIAATSPRSKVGENVRNASYYYHRIAQGKGAPEVGEKNPAPYGHMAQRLHQMNAKAVEGAGWDPLKNPKPASFVENLSGNQLPGTIDTHAFRLPAMLAKDPRFLATDYQSSKDAPKRNLMKEVERGDIGVDDAPSAGWQSIPKDNEYRHLEHFYRDLGRERGMTTAQTQASAWVGGGALTGLGSDESKPFLRFLEDRVHLTAKHHKMDPKDVLHAFIRGDIPLRADGGRVVARKDGAVLSGWLDGRRGQTAIAFEPHQVKHAELNNGDFNPESPDITKARGGLVAPKGLKMREVRGPRGERVLHVDSLGGPPPALEKTSDHWSAKALERVVKE